MKKAKRAAVVDTAAVIDTDGLTKQYRENVAAALPRGVDPPAEFWRDLEAAVTAFVSWQQRRKRRPAKGELKRWRTSMRWRRSLALKYARCGGPPVGATATRYGQIGRWWRCLTSSIMRSAHIVGAETILAAFQSPQKSRSRISVSGDLRSLAAAPGPKAHLLEKRRGSRAGRL